MAVDDLDRAEATLAGLGLAGAEVVKLPRVGGRFFPVGDGDGRGTSIEFVEGEARSRRLRESGKTWIDHITFGVGEIESVTPPTRRSAWCSPARRSQGRPPRRCGPSLSQAAA